MIDLAIIMATMRAGNWGIILNHIKAAQGRGARIHWFPVLYPREVKAATPEQRGFLFGFDAPRWIHPIVIAEELGVNHCLRKQNAALDHLEASGFAGWFVGWSDDNLIPQNIGKRVAMAAQQEADGHKDVIIFSHKRGQRIPAEDPKLRYGTSDLIAAPENVRVGCISGEQYFIHTRALNGRRWPHHPCADGVLIEQMWRENPGDFVYVPDYFTPFNALEPGRWDEDELRKVIEAE